mmetsp:Transcript_27297/g.52926  ORF Transcript_27297/g.52926 Transcript_27297/m.52926 type:complete len:259 (+) Transcript_27297:223-999(+)
MWNDDLEEFIGAKPPNLEEIDMDKVFDILKNKGGYEGELEKSVSDSLGVDIITNRKARMALLEGNPEIENGIIGLTTKFDRALDGIFDAYDIDGDEILSLSEMSAMYVKCNQEPMPQDFWDDLMEFADHTNSGLTRKGFREYMTLQATTDAEETIRDLQALGFKEEFPDVKEITDDDIDEFIMAQGDPNDIEAEINALEEQIQAKDPELFQNVESKMAEDEEGPDYGDDDSESDDDFDFDSGGDIDIELTPAQKDGEK